MLQVWEHENHINQSNVGKYAGPMVHIWVLVLQYPLVPMEGFAI